MSRISYNRLSAALVGLVVPLTMVAPAAAQLPGPEEVAAVELECYIGLAFPLHTCNRAVIEGLYEVVETETGGAVDLGFAEGTEPGDFPYDINAIPLNPLPPVAATGTVILPPNVAAE